MRTTSSPLAPSKPLNFLISLFIFYVVLSNLQRLVYLVWITVLDKTFPANMGAALILGPLFDLAASFYLFLPLMATFLVLPNSWLSRRAGRSFLLLVSVVPLYIATCSAACEFFFFEEFHARFNFIAVDYIVYTNEVFRNIVESYTLPVVIATFTLPLLVIWYVLRKLIRRLDLSQPNMRTKWQFAGILMILLCAATFTSESRLLEEEASWPREVSKNSIFTLFTAYNRNSISFTEFYTTLNSANADTLTQNWLSGGFERQIKNPIPEKRWNVVLVAMESMSAQYLAHFGDRRALTPNLDHLMEDGLSFTSLYATGTRTVRGLEALMLSLPPTPGQSILRRPKSDGLFNLGTVFRERGYKTQFVYGGYALFDNMKEWFESNGFDVVDRAQFPSSQIHFANAWGVCDEDLFTQVLNQQEALVKAGTPFMQVVLTTSNHRPYTFPDGRIDIASHTGREGALKYSDFSIGRFIEQAKTKPWFDNTLFIFVADHDASVAGGSDIPVRDFLIPAIIYSPKLVPPQKIAKLASQIDLAPTLLGLLSFSYKSKFFGQDLTQHPGGRALLGTYQKVGYLQPNSLTILSPGQKIEMQELDDKHDVKKTTTVHSRDGKELPESAKLAVAIYQTASRLFTQGFFKHSADSSNPAQ